MKEAFNFAGGNNKNMTCLISSTSGRLKNIFVYFVIKLADPKAVLRSGFL